MPTSDVIVIGGGVIGAAAGFELARKGVSVTILEREGIGAGSTGRSSAIIRQHYSNEITARMALEGLRVFQNFDDIIGGDCGFRQTGFLALARKTDRHGFEANVALQRSVGINTIAVPPQDLSEFLPASIPDGVDAAAFEPESGFADPHLTVDGYLQAVRRLGGGVLFNTEVTGIRLAGDVVLGVDTTKGRFDAASVINCAGPWGARVARMAQIDVPVNACRAQVAVFKRPANLEHAEHHPVVLDFVHASYFRSEIGDLTLVGLIDPSEADDIVDPDAFDDRIDDEFALDVGERWVRRCPPMADSAYTGGYAGLYAVTPDWHPVIDEVPSGSGHFLCTGFSGHGFKLAPAVGRMVTDMVTRETSPRFRTDCFHLQRFAHGSTVEGQYAFSITG